MLFRDIASYTRCMFVYRMCVSWENSRVWVNIHAFTCYTRISTRISWRNSCQGACSQVSAY